MKKSDHVILVEAQLRSYSRVKDGTMNIGFRTAREMSNEEAKQIDSHFQGNGWLVFKENEPALEDIPDAKAEIKGQVSPSQYLRNRLFAKHMANGGTKEDFPDYYHKAIYGFAQAVDDSYEVK